MAVRPEVWRSARWDARFPIFYEDADYCFQARARGFDAVATAAVTVLHHAHTTSQERAAEAERNRGLWVQKWKEQIG
jgi:GT2 family glycosyltransferase